MSKLSELFLFIFAKFSKHIMTEEVNKIFWRNNMKKLNKIIEIPCEEESKEAIASLIRERLVDNDDYINSNIVVKADRFEAVDVIVYEGCSNVKELTRMLLA